MKTKANIYKIAITVCSFLLTCSSAFSQSQDIISFANVDEFTVGLAIPVDDPFVNDDPGPSADPNFVIDSKESLVSLHYGKQFNSNVLGEYWELRIKFFREFVGGTIPDTGLETLTIAFDESGGIDQSLSVFQVPTDVSRVKIHITEICAQLTPGQNNWDCNETTALPLVPADIRLESILRISKIERFDIASSMPQLMVVDDPNNDANKIAELRWSHVPGAMEYLVEWAYEDHMVSQSPTDVFDQAASVRVKNNCHKINLTYPSGENGQSSNMHYRVTAIGRIITSAVNGDYSYEVMGIPKTISESIGTAATDGFETDRNWQVQRTFAEDGKQKDIVQYFDDGLKPRQTITNLSTQEQMLVAESKFDFHGRPRLNILPTPLSKSNSLNLFYRSDINNADDNGSPVVYGRTHFDKASGAEPLLTNSGASQYYSGANDIESIYRDYIPDAEGYPITVMEYKRDNSGRVTRQGGVGKFYQLDTDRETKYFYTSAKSTELHRLFGSNVGLAKHYKKNYVVDANGQVSVSYIDQNGNVVATALAGANPTNVQPLDGVTLGADVRLNLMDNNDVDSTTQESVTTATIMNLTPTVYNFTYNLTTGAVSTVEIDLPNGTTDQLCFACDYKLRIEIYDPCDERIFDSGEIIIDNGDGCTVNASLTDLNLNVPEFTDIGEYKIYKTLEVIPQTREEIRQLLEENNQTIFSSIKADIITHLGDVDTSPCDYLLETGTATGTDYEMEVADAFDSQCEILLTAMETQVSPGGYLFESNTFIAEFDDLLMPPDPMADPPHFLYGDCEAVSFPSNVNTDAERKEYLLDNWNPCWARVLVEHHDEYCHYEFCLEEQSAGVFSFDSDLYLISTWTEASGANGPVNNGVIDSDPFFSGGDLGDSNGQNEIIDWQQDLDDYNEEYPDMVSLESFVESQIDPSIDPLSVEYDEEKWKGFRAVYLGMRTTFKRQAVLDYDCEYQTHDYRLVPDPDLPPADEAEIDATIIEQLGSHCGDLCAGNADYWLLQLVKKIEEECPNATLTNADLETFRYEFYDYCNSTCMTGLNPLGQITLDFLMSNPPPHLFDDLNAWLANCPGVTLENTIAVDPPTTNNNMDPFYECVQIFPEGPQPRAGENTERNSRVTPEPDPVPFCDECNYTEGLLDEGEWIAIKNANGDEIDWVWRKGSWNITALGNMVHNVSENSSCGGTNGGSRPTVSKGDPISSVSKRSSARMITGNEAFPRNPLKIAFMLDELIKGASNCTNLNPMFTDYPKVGDTDVDYISDAMGYVYNFFGVPKTLEVMGPVNFSYTLANQQDTLCQILSPYAADTNPPEERLIRFNNDWGLGLENTDELDQLLLQMDLWEFSSCLSNVNEPNEFEICSAEWVFDCPEEYWVCSWNFDPMIPDPTTVYNECIADITEESDAVCVLIEQTIVDNIIDQFIEAQGLQCLKGDLDEEFSYLGAIDEYHYTLYYYDQAGSLVQTIPPEAVQPLPSTSFDDDGVWQGAEPLHNDSLLTRYRYNARGQVVWQRSPDGGLAEFYYDTAGRLKLSQDEKQRTEGYASNPIPDSEQQGFYSYTRYDEHDRIIEVGQVENYQFEGEHQNVDFPTGFMTDQETWTVYDQIESGDTPGIPTERLRNRVAKSFNTEVTTFYSYDIHGNVKELEHQIPGLGNKSMRYEYDLISGNVLEMAYQEGEQDQFFHRYEYDADNRLTYTHTSEDGYIWEADARNFYYAHGPLARMEIGEDIVQGQDYYYSLQGWIKGVNIPGANSWEHELGMDGNFNEGNANRNIARDEMAYGLGYNDQDYLPIANTDGDSNNDVDLGSAGSGLWNDLNADILSKSFVQPGNTQTIAGLYNGNIAAMITDIREFDEPKAMAYQYDALHRIKQGKDYDLMTNGTWSLVDVYSTSMSYDANGNLDTLRRKGPNAVNQGTIDQLAYTYDEVAAKKRTNKLLRVTDMLGDPLGFTDPSGNWFYQYDSIGNLTYDPVADAAIDWTVYGKVDEVNFASALSNETERFSYDYGPDGNRLVKRKVVKDNASENENRYYVRDASGNVISIYREYQSEFFQEEAYLYGSSRLGFRHYIDKQIDGGSLPSILNRTRGYRRFELNNHLGNVLAVVNDHKLGFDDDAGFPGAERYAAEIISASDYYPFGLQHQDESRNFSPADYRYGFNGKEKDQDGEFGSMTHYDYGFRIYNPGIGKFLSVDPLVAEYPFFSPYHFAGNDPISNIDLDGLEPTKPQLYWSPEPVMEKILWGDLKNTNLYLTVGIHSNDQFFKGASKMLVAERWFDGHDPYYQYYDNAKGWVFFDPHDIGDPDEVADIAVGAITITAAIVTGLVIIDGIGLVYVAEEAGEFVFEELTGIPIIMDPVDLLERGFRKSLRSQVKNKLQDKYSKEVIDGPGSYTITYKDGTKYHGKGNVEEGIQRAYKKSNGDHVTNFDWTPSKDNASAFRDEAKRLNNDGGYKSDTNRNLQNSPGNVKYKEE